MREGEGEGLALGLALAEGAPLGEPLEVAQRLAEPEPLALPLREGLALAMDERDEAIRERGQAILNAWEEGEEFADGQFIQNAADALAEIVGRDVAEVYKALDILLVFTEVDDEAVVMLDELFGHLAHGDKRNE